MTVKELLKWGRKELDAVPVTEPAASAEFLLRQALIRYQGPGSRVQKISRAEFFTMLDVRVEPLQEKIYRGYIERRMKHEPVWQIVGKVEFWGLDFFVNQDVLVPRPETEFLVEQVIQQITSNKKLPTLRSESRLSDNINNENVGEISNESRINKLHFKKINRNLEFVNRKSNPFRILDIGTGAGPIAIALANELSLREGQADGAIFCSSHSELVSESQRSRNKFGMTTFVATDISAEALKIAKMNAKANGVADIIEFVQADLFKPIARSQKLAADKFDVVTANLPYIPNEDLGGLALEIHHYEPRVSLDGGEGGLVIYEEFLKELPTHLNPGGMVFCEIGKGQGKKFCDLAKKYLTNAKCKITKDIAGIDRIAIINN